MLLVFCRNLSGIGTHILNNGFNCSALGLPIERPKSFSTEKFIQMAPGLKPV